MLATQAAIKDQLPPDAQISGNGKDVAGVIDESLQDDGDVLAYQARNMARARQGMIYGGGTDLSNDLIRQQVVRAPKDFINRAMNAETIDALTQGALNRDQQYVGNNADWTGYYLEPLAKFVVPFDTPFRNMLPRTQSVGIDTENWRAIVDVFGGTGPSIGSFILPQQTAPQKASYSWSNKSNLLRQLAFSDIVTFESELYGQMFDPNVRATVAAKLTPSLMVGQELWYLNAAQQCWSPAPINAVSVNNTTGSVGANTWWILVTAANVQGESLAWSYAPSTVAVPLAVSAVTTGGASSITFNINRVPGATKYNVYMGTGTTQPANGSMWLQSATTNFGGATALNDPGGFSAGYFSVTCNVAPATSGTAYSTVITSNAPTTPPYQAATGSTPSGYILTFDGIQALAYLNAGTAQTAGTGGENAILRRPADIGGVLAKSDIDGWLEAMYLNARANPEAILCGVKDHKALSNIVTSSTNFRVNATPTMAGVSDLVGGFGRATKWINQTTGRVMDIVMCPYLTQGTLVALSLTLPFSVAEITKPPLRISVNREMWSIEYPPDQSHMTQWAYSAFTSETMVNQYLGGTGLLTGIVTA